MSLPVRGRRKLLHRFPRVSGDEPMKYYDYFQVSEFSPRERG